MITCEAGDRQPRTA
uniref:Uncharacterized protein n=1 Tax=Rhizophora mucronata TaxID=61149 RepID=A0A2P2MYV6_RHIMU